MIKHALTLVTLITLLACFRANAGQEDVDKLLTMDETERGSYIEQMRVSVNNTLSESYTSYICTAANRKTFSQFARVVDGIKERVNDPEFKNLTYAEIAFYVKCDEEQNPFYKNIHPDEIYFTADELSETTLEMIRAMGPLLLAKGPDGKTALEHVQDRLDHAIEYGEKYSAMKSIYARIKSEIIFRIDELREAQ